VSLDAIIVNGQEVACDAKVFTWHETGMQFDCHVMRRRTSNVVVHWTGAENPPEQMFENLRAHTNALGKPEPLSVHFAVDAQGDVYQFCDAQAFGAHAQGVNDRTVGIEVVCRGDATTPTRGVQRQVVAEKIHGQTVAYSAFTPAQTRTVLALTESLCRAYSLPMKVPLLGDDVYPTELPAIARATFQGVIGHLHVRRGKRDPGLKILRAIHARGATQNNLRV
jgi:N-acetyl-anhydromuramyl-L-alanine amidase AmpD